jgi:hypothetical protein
MGGQPYGEAMIVKVAFTLRFNTRLFHDACRPLIQTSFILIALAQ